MKRLLITLENTTITIEHNKSILEFNSILELKNSGIISTIKLDNLLKAIETAQKHDISTFKFNL
tara:strand:+ start:72 stop:263 length:192 start_codon:yes stop_codon:yes gene_type:complete